MRPETCAQCRSQLDGNIPPSIREIFCGIRPGPGPPPLRVACEISTLHVTIEAAVVTDVECALLLTNDEQHPRGVIPVRAVQSGESEPFALMRAGFDLAYFPKHIAAGGTWDQLSSFEDAGFRGKTYCRSDVDHSLRFGRMTAISGGPRLLT